ncbi:MAG: response regulator [Chloroflexi bacterium]|nr:response regulator [Chloroflexota bacterium]
MKTILIVEDTPLNVDLLVQMLEDHYTLLIAEDGHRGVQCALEDKPDLILMDISLPILDGLEATRRILAHSNTNVPPIFGLSAHAMSADEQKARGAGCVEYLTKPVDEELLLKKIKEYLG